MSPLLAYFSSAFLAAFCPPQDHGGAVELGFHLDGAPEPGQFGSAVADFDDLDGNGLADLLVGAPFEADAGCVYVLSAATGRPLLRIVGARDGDRFGYSVSRAGDLNGDGVPDLLIGAVGADPQWMYGAGAAEVRSGADGSLLKRFVGEAPKDYFGASVVGGNDFDGDSVPDIVVAAHSASPGGVPHAGSVYAFSGSTAALLWRLDGSQIGSRLGEGVASGRDWSGDGCADLLVGEPAYVASGEHHGGRVILCSGKDGSVLLEVTGLEEMHLGVAVSATDDVDGDGVPDFLAGAPSNGIPTSSGTGGDVLLYSGSNGNTLLHFQGQVANTQIGNRIAWLGDLNQDGVGEFAFSWHLEDSAYAGSDYEEVVIASADGREFARFLPGGDAPYTGRPMARAGDLDGDGASEILLGSPYADATTYAQGAIEIWSFLLGMQTSSTTLSAAAGGQINAQIDFPRDAGGDLYQVLASASGQGPVPWGGVSIPLSVDSLFMRTLLGVYPFVVQGGVGQLNASGDRSFLISASPNSIPPSAIGSTFHFAVVCGQAAGHWRYSSMARTLEILP